MASCDITIRCETRPCYVDGRKAMWHKWVDVSEIVPPSIAIGGHGGGVVRDTLALVEYEDGDVAKVYAEKVKFADHGAFRETAWEKGEN